MKLGLHILRIAFLVFFLGLLSFVIVTFANGKELTKENKVGVSISCSEELVKEMEDLKGFSLTAYTSDPLETDNSPCLAAKGHDICSLYANGTLTVATYAFPINTKLFIPGWGEVLVLDRMNERFRGVKRIDVYMGMNKQQAKNWGVKRNVTVKRIINETKQFVCQAASSKS